MTATERERIEKRVAGTFGATTNYFQEKARGLIQPTDIMLKMPVDGTVRVSWQAGYAGANPIRSWQIRSGGKTLLTIPFRPQLTMAPLTAWLAADQIVGGKVEVIASETI
jgi:hypothetical protein